MIEARLVDHDEDDVFVVALVGRQMPETPVEGLQLDAMDRLRPADGQGEDAGEREQSGEGEQAAETFHGDILAKKKPPRRAALDWWT